jgi:CelD/BcsL family acetyltransferase involved in cellulose biosynthesis
MKIHAIAADRLTPEQIDAWSTLQSTETIFDSPYFRPEFTQAVASVRRDVEVAVFEESGEPVGFFPFQRARNNVALPVGGMMSDFHGVVIRPDTMFDPRQLLRDCGLSAWQFNHLVVGQIPFQPYHWCVDPSPYLDLSHGWEHYQSEQLVIHKDSFKKTLRKLQKAERDAGPLRLEIRSTDPAVFQSMVEWKMGQYLRSEGTNVLGFDWTVGLLQRILAVRDEAFCGMLSALYLGDTLAAVLLSMRSHGVLHGWFSSYGQEFNALSPGLLLWLKLAEALPALGIRRVDLGKGPERYKRELMSGAIDLAEGTVDLQPLRAMARHHWHRAYQWARQSSLRRPLLAPARFLRRMVEARSFR